MREKSSKKTHNDTLPTSPYLMHHRLQQLFLFPNILLPLFDRLKRTLDWWNSPNLPLDHPNSLIEPLTFAIWFCTLCISVSLHKGIHQCGNGGKGQLTSLTKQIHLLGFRNPINHRPLLGIPLSHLTCHQRHWEEPCDSYANRESDEFTNKGGRMYNHNTSWEPTEPPL